MKQVLGGFLVSAQFLTSDGYQWNLPTDLIVEPNLLCFFGLPAFFEVLDVSEND